MKTFLRSDRFPLLVLVVISLSIGLLTFRHYGESWDEHNFLLYAGESLEAYRNISDPGFSLQFQDPTLRFYGPWFYMLVLLAGRLLPGLIITEVAHLLSFLAFLAGVIFFFLLSRRWFKPAPAFAATLLFISQPLLWGHAFINSRDIPFMAAFLGAIYTGLRMVDGLSPADLLKPADRLQNTGDLIKQDTRHWKAGRRIILLLVFLAGILLLAWAALTLSDNWASRAGSMADTTSARQLDLYLRLVLARFWGAMVFVLGIISWACLLFLPQIPRTRSRLWQLEIRPMLRVAWRLVRKPAFVWAALLLGLTIATRIAGLFAGLLVLVILFRRHGRSASLAAFSYLILSFPVIFLTWPYLWEGPILRLLISARVMLDFPWPGEVLYEGLLWKADELPRLFLPKFLSLQLTEPVLVLVLIAAGCCLWRAKCRAGRSDLFILLVAWFGLPFLAAVVGKPFRYDNFRQYLFILPPIFLLSALAMDSLILFLRRTAWQVSLTVLLVLPGIINACSLHPYEYIYYNSLTGGAAGASGRYELDYWGTSLKAMAEYANRELPVGESVVVWGPSTSFWRYARPDLKVFDWRDPLRPRGGFHAVILNRAGNEILVYPQLADIHTVSIQGIPLATVKVIQP
jgi:hypothetical protein